MENDLEDNKTLDTFFSEFYEEWYYQDLLGAHLLEALHIGSIGNKSQQLAEKANKTKTERPIEKIVPAYVLKRFAKIFSQEASQQLPEHLQWDHKINMKPGWEPMGCKLYPLTEEEEDKLHKMLQEYLKWGTIRISKSPQASPFFFVKKKKGDLRPVQDYRRLNE
ncbi:hypothetical protein HETIRDRAFT_45742 [Heterobasidion irregulare TC 32-1]|uniref:Reverse transcriptase domain-containing protein n=1 Tax=Heterobasidion irregulare (strain TC 32-1) TaxID=747525 RepID=W4K8I9_HETIT|nr:uncharacterized protein HETIRDRAFT_45742 [Heterobasidion irregulare TC 32-1]ETW82069.1 hypothetical protein HETIRDRAFT_45742 [Heterobasidion irregulare TC 32-1]